MKNFKLFRQLTLFVALAIFLSPVLAMAQPDDSDNWRGRRGNRHMGPGGNSDMICKALSLTAPQQELFEVMKTATMDHSTLQRNSKRALRTAFDEQLLLENPDFQAVADALKAEYGDKMEASYDNLIASKVAFFKSLSLEQRQELVKLHKEKMDRRGGKGGRGGGFGGGY